MAAYKAQHGLQTVAFDQIEPRAEEHVKKRKARQSLDSNLPPNKRQALGHSKETSSLDANHPFPPSMSLYDAMMTPNLNSVYGSFSPRLGEQFAESSIQTPNPSPPRLKTIIQTDPLTGIPHPSSPVSSVRDEMPFARPDSPQGIKSRDATPIHRRTGSLPAPFSSRDFPRNTKELAQAANALSNLTQSPAGNRTISGVPVTPPPSLEGIIKKSPRSTSAPTMGGRQRSKTAPGEGDRETAAELMLYLASSPSPSQKKTMDSLPGSEPPLKGRKLFTEEEMQPFAMSPLPLQPTPRQQTQSVPLQTHSVPLQPQKMPQLPVAAPYLTNGTPILTNNVLNGLPPFSTAESYSTQPTLYYPPLPPSFSMPISPAAYAMSYSMPPSAAGDPKADAALYFSQSAPPSTTLQPQRNTQFDMMYMPGPQAPPQYSIPFQYGQTW